MASSHAQSVDRLIGRIVDTNDIVEEKLGEGGMGAVYRCRHRHFAGDYVALKVLSAAAPGAQGATQNLIDRFLQEARAASLVASKRVVQMYGAGQFEDGSWYLTMECIPGRGLAQVLRHDGPLPLLFAMMPNNLTFKQPDQVAVADFSGDGNLDAVVLLLSGLSVNLDLLLGNGDGTFQAPKELSVGGTIRGLAVADLNEDNHPDIVVSEPFGDWIHVALGNGDGTLKPAVQCTAGMYADRIAIGDLNKDGNLDVAVTDAQSSPPTISVLFGDGTGALGTAKAVAAGAMGTDPLDLAFGDFNGDAAVDIAVLTNNKAGNESYLHDVAVGDFNKDGKLDLFTCANGSPGQVALFLNTSK